ncbi:MAG: glycosyltransferase family 4 protein [Candidatus Omnitrophica bacterium]|nr:glycosyltransferase family 4 protein [Candidatus Omnitrophota bacterium]
MKNGKKKKIIIFNPAANLYGTERGLMNFIKAIGDRFEVTVILPETGPLVEQLRRLPFSCRIKIFPLAILVNSYSPLYYLFFLMYSLLNVGYFTLYIAVKKIDIVCTNSLLIPTPALIAWILKRTHIWYIWEMSPRVALNRLCSRYIQTFSSAIICASHTIKTYLALPDSTKVVYNPIDPAQYRIYAPARARRDLALPQAAIVLTIIARIHPSKGQLEFLRSYHTILKKYPEVILLIVGDIGVKTLRNSMYKKNLLHFIRTHCPNNIRYVGARNDIDKLLSASDICIFPFCRIEPFGIALAEALSFQKRCLFPGSGGFKEIGTLFSQGEELRQDTLEEAILQCRTSKKETVKELFVPFALSVDYYTQAIENILAR